MKEAIRTEKEVLNWGDNDVYEVDEIVSEPDHLVLHMTKGNSEIELALNHQLTVVKGGEWILWAEATPSQREFEACFAKAFSDLCSHLEPDVPVTARDCYWVRYECPETARPASGWLFTGPGADYFLRRPPFDPQN